MKKEIFVNSNLCFEKAHLFFFLIWKSGFWLLCVSAASAPPPAELLLERIRVHPFPFFVAFSLCSSTFVVHAGCFFFGDFQSARNRSDTAHICPVFDFDAERFWAVERRRQVFENSTTELFQAHLSESGLAKVRMHIGSVQDAPGRLKVDKQDTRFSSDAHRERLLLLDNGPLCNGESRGAVPGTCTRL